jgi:hypothetical protein
MCFEFPELDPSAPAVDSQVSDLGVDDSGKRNCLVSFQLRAWCDPLEKTVRSSGPGNLRTPLPQ